MSIEKLLAIIVIAGATGAAIGAVADSYAKAEIAKANALVKVAELSTKPCK